MDLFKDFDPSSKAQWVAKITADLKGKSLEALQWDIEESIAVSPFYTPEDAPEGLRVPVQGSNNDWNIGEDVSIADDYKAANAQVLDALMRGVNAPTFVLAAAPSTAQLNQLLHEVELGYITTHFDTSEAATVKALLSLLQARQQLWSNLGGSFTLRNNDTATLAATLDQLHETLPRFRAWSVGHDIAFAGTSHISSYLAAVATRLVTQLNALQDHGIAAATAWSQLHVQVQVGVSFFPAIAQLRALKILLQNIAQAYGITQELPPIHVRTAQEAHMTDDQHTNMIRTTTQAMSAVIGGVQRLTVTPADAFQGQSTAFTRRIARNVQHLLKFESHLHHVQDAAHGSYYIEQLTAAFAEVAWKQFQTQCATA